MLGFSNEPNVPSLVSSLTALVTVGTCFLGVKFSSEPPTTAKIGEVKVSVLPAVAFAVSPTLAVTKSQ